MAKYKAAKSKKGSPKSTAGAKAGFLPCAIIILLGFILIFALFYFSITSN